MTLFFRNLNRKSKQPLVFYRYQLFKFTCLSRVGHLLLHNIWHATTQINKKKGKNQKLPISARERCRSPSKHMLWKQKLRSISNVVKFCSVRMLNNVTVFIRDENNSKNGHLCTKIRKFCLKTRSSKSKKTFC